MVLYCNFTSLAFLGLLGFLRRQLKIKFIATLLRAAKLSNTVKPPSVCVAGVEVFLVKDFSWTVEELAGGALGLAEKGYPKP